MRKSYVSLFYDISVIIMGLSSLYESWHNLAMDGPIL